MKKGGLVIVGFAFIFLLSVSIVSAGWFSDLFSGKSITGNLVRVGASERLTTATGTNLDVKITNVEEGYVTFFVTNPETGAVKKIEETEGQTVTAFGEQLRIGRVTEGKLFSRGGAVVEFVSEEETKGGCCIFTSNDGTIFQQWTETESNEYGGECEKWGEAHGGIYDDVSFNTDISKEECGEVTVGQACTSSCQYIKAEDILAQGSSIKVAKACSNFATGYSPAGVVRREESYLFPDDVCGAGYILKSSSDMWFSFKSAGSNPLLTTLINTGACNRAPGVFSTRQDTQTFKGVLCCSQVCDEVTSPIECLDDEDCLGLQFCNPESKICDDCSPLLDEYLQLEQTGAFEEIDAFVHQHPEIDNCLKWAEAFGYGG